MPDATVLPDATTTNGALLVLAIVLPSAGVLLSSASAGGTSKGLPPFSCRPVSSLRLSSSPTSGEAASG